MLAPSALGLIARMSLHFPSIGRLTLVQPTADFSTISLTEKPPIAPLRTSSSTVETVVRVALERADAVIGSSRLRRERT